MVWSNERQCKHTSFVPRSNIRTALVVIRSRCVAGLRQAWGVSHTLRPLEGLRLLPQPFRWRLLVLRDSNSIRVWFPGICFWNWFRKRLSGYVVVPPRSGFCFSFVSFFYPLFLIGPDLGCWLSSLDLCLLWGCAYRLRELWPSALETSRYVSTKPLFFC